MAAALRPPFTYYGGKTMIADKIAAALPSHQHYVEPFAGGLSVLLAKTPAAQETVNDLDGDLMTFWRVLRDRPEELIRACSLTPHSLAEYRAGYEATSDDLERARRVWVCLSQGRAGTMQRTGWRQRITPVGDFSIPDYLAGYVDRMAVVAKRLSRVSLESRPALELVATYGRSADVLLYVDPPYLGTTRGGTNYQHEMPGEAEHRELAQALCQVKAAVVVSGYPSPLYDQIYAGWHTLPIPTQTGNGISQARVEMLWSNRPMHAQIDLFAGAV